ncbi:hypothetical protein ASPCAL14872 [Aspergillus calidoustus]|uniref:Uncharacterized protein n=1 Tax=Aspergillus calidoustus TaxID=454130 RepID=A0A0U5GJ30_ASPCI|nr:hypothetical protein ASPCAL14872 [Aspergillus calidoustus]
MKSPPQSLPKFSTSLRPPLMLDQVRTVLPYLCPPQLECAQLWIDEARILQDSSFTLVTLVDRMWGLTNEEVAFARLRIYGPFTMEWIQREIPDLRPTQMVLAQWIVEHSRLMMECPKPVVSGSHRALQRLVTPDILAGLLALSASQRRRVSRRLRPQWRCLGRDRGISLLYGRSTVECGDADGATMVAVPLAGAIT